MARSQELYRLNDSIRLVTELFDSLARYHERWSGFLPIYLFLVIPCLGIIKLALLAERAILRLRMVIGLAETY